VVSELPSLRRRRGVDGEDVGVDGEDVGVDGEDVGVDGEDADHGRVEVEDLGPQLGEARGPEQGSSEAGEDNC